MKEERKLRQLLQINWEDHITNNAVLERARTRSIEDIIIRHLDTDSDGQAVS